MGWWVVGRHPLGMQPSPLSSQHFALLLKYLIHVAIPDIPGWVAEEMAKLEYQRREAFKVCGLGLAPYPLLLHGTSPPLPAISQVLRRRANTQGPVR